MNLTDKCIIVQGEPKTLAIDRINLKENGVYRISFKRSHQFYSYRNVDVYILEHPVALDPLQCKVYSHGVLQKHVKQILYFEFRESIIWRIAYNTGFEKEYKDNEIYVLQSCLSDKIAKNVWEYLKHVAYTNELGKSEDSEGILYGNYIKTEIMYDNLSIAPYLNPKHFKLHKLNPPSTLIFPFGCNASQEKAVRAAFNHQISVIQGPPGTGKTQTILNIIANLVIQKKSVLVVSNNNSATANVLEKLQKYGFDFICASLGKKDNKEEFIENQPALPEQLKEWDLSKDQLSIKVNLHNKIIKQLQEVFRLQEDLAVSTQQLKDLQLEWGHFKEDNHVDEQSFVAKEDIEAKCFMDLWMKYQHYFETNNSHKGFIKRFIEKWRLFWINHRRKKVCGLQTEFRKENRDVVILEVQTLYYLRKIKELKSYVSNLERRLKGLDGDEMNRELTDVSLELFKYGLFHKYKWKERNEFKGIDLSLSTKAKEFLEQFPVVLSTTFSAKTSLSRNIQYDYLIMDEASQVSVETGALALSCAKNAVIVGDTLQLPNVITQNDKLKLDAVFRDFKVSDGYNSCENSFLDSVCSIIPDVHQTLLREHYRCHPKIINFCNQKFYGGNLLIMTKDHDEWDAMNVIQTIPGSHRRGNYNQREIDVILHEVLPDIKDRDKAGVITPYVQQKLAIREQIPDIEADTIHKFQGREKDDIILSCVDDQISDFSDDPNLLNVAISRAKKHFCLVVTGNEQERKGNLNDLVDYIEYNNFMVTKSKVKSIFDFLYSQYTKERIELLSRNKTVSNYDSENLTYLLLCNILQTHTVFSHLGVFCHIPLRNIINDTSLLSEEEKKYAENYNTHVDFLIYNKVSKKPVLTVETDGYSFHNAQTEQFDRDQMKNHILECCGIPLLRLSTTGSGEKQKVISALEEALK